MAVPLIQVTNVAPLATDQQMKELFSYLGSIGEIKVYPESTSLVSFPSKVCFIRFKEILSCQTALHLTNSILVDRALIVVNSKYTEIPDETVALSLAAPAIAVANIAAQQPLTHTAPLLPTPPSLLNMTSGIGTSVLGTPPTTAAAAMAALSAAIPGLAGLAPNVVGTLDQLALIRSLQQTIKLQAVSAAAPPVTQPLISVMGTVVPQPPPLTGNVDPTKIEEIRRTVYVGNLSTKPKVTAEQVLTFFQPCGEIKYVRMAGDETQPTRFAFVEFSMPDSVPMALQYNGAMFGDRPVKVNHSKNAIVKPQGPTPQEEKREVEEAMKRIKEANKAIAKAMVVEPTPPPVEKPKNDTHDRKKRSRSRSYSRSRSGSGSREKSSRRKRSRSKSRDRRRKSYSRSPHRRSKSPRRRSRTPPRYGGRYYSARRDYGNYSRRSPSPRRDRHRHRDKERERVRERERERERERRERERDRERRDRKRSWERRKSVSLSPRRSPSKKSRSSRKKESKREVSRTPSPLDARASSPHHDSPSHSSSKRSKKSKKDKKKRHKRSPSYSVSPSPSGSEESHSPSPVAVAATFGGAAAGSMSWGSEEEEERRESGREKMMNDEEEGNNQSLARESEEDMERDKSQEERGHGGSGESEDSERGSPDREESRGEELSDVE